MGGTDGGGGASSAPETLYPRDYELAVLGARETALGVLDLIFSTPDWIHRRAEHAEIVTASHFRRHVSVDFTVPLNCDAKARWLDGEAVHLVPVDILAKQPLVGFDLRDEDDRPVPVLTRRQNGHLSWRALLAYSEDLLGENGLTPVPGWVSEQLRQVAQGAEDAALRALAELRSRASDHHALEALLGEDGFPVTAEMLARNFVLTAVLPAKEGARRILKYGFEEPFALANGAGPHGRFDRLLARARRHDRSEAGSIAESLGLRATSLSFRVPSFSDCESYHFEATAPDGIEFIDIVLSDDALADQRGGPVTDEWTLGFRRVLESSPHRAHLATSRTSDDEGRQDEFLQPFIKVQLRVERNGWLRSSALAGILVSVFMAASWPWIARWDSRAATCAQGPKSCVEAAHPFTTDPSAFTVALLGVVFLAVIRAGEHPYTARVLRDLRLVAIADAIVPIAAAWFLVFPGAGLTLTVGWSVLTLMSVCATVILCFAWTARPPVDEAG